VAAKDFYPRLAGALLLSLGAASLMPTDIPWNGVIAGIAAVTSLALVRSAARTSRKEGRTDSMKVALVSSTVLYELVLLIGAASVSSKFASVIAVAAVGFSELLHVETSQKLKQTFAKSVGREGRVLVLAASLAAHSFNTWFLFYGLVFIALLAIYDSLVLIHRLYREL
jgi:hypothetical protein